MNIDYLKLILCILAFFYEEIKQYSIIMSNLIILYGTMIIICSMYLEQIIQRKHFIIEVIISFLIIYKIYT